MTTWNRGAELFASGNYIAVNRSLIKAVGLECAVLIGELASEAMYWDEHLDDGWFFSTVENVENATGLTGYQQRKALAKLAELGIVEVQQKGLPKRRYVRVNFEQVAKIIDSKSSKNFTTSSEKTSPLEVKKLHVNKNNKQQQVTTTKNNNKAPELSEVVAYVKDKGYHFDPKQFYDYYSASGWKMQNGKQVKNWKQCCVTWERNTTDKGVCWDADLRDLAERLDF